MEADPQRQQVDSRGLGLKEGHVEAGAEAGSCLDPSRADELRTQTNPSLLQRTLRTEQGALSDTPMACGGGPHTCPASLPHSLGCF